MTIADDAESFFESGNEKALLRFAEECWAVDLVDLTPEHAEVARYARVVANRSHSPSEPLWQARAVAAAASSGNLRSVALSLQAYLFPLAARSLEGQARQVIDLMEALADLDVKDLPPRRRLVDRITAERRAYTYSVEERWEDAVIWYDRASSLAPAGSRGAAKVAGGAAVARWLAGGSDADAVDAFAPLAEVKWPDVRDAALANLAAAKNADRAAAVPFDQV